MEKEKVLSKLMWDLQSFLSVLDSENLSYIAQAQKKSISELVSSLQRQEPPVEDAEYVIMNCPSSSSPSNQAAGDSNIWTRDVVPTVPRCPPGGSQAPAGDDDEDEDTYEEAQPYKDNSTCHLERAESENSYYESYGEDAEDDDDDNEEHVKDRAHYIQWSSSQPCLRPPPESRLCGYLWRRKWLGQWTKQLFIVRNHSLLCYKCARDLLPHLQLSLRGCQLVYKLKSNRKIPHQLRLLLLGANTLVLGYSSFQQADEWRRVIEELSVGDEDQNTCGSSIEPPLSSHRSCALLTPTNQQEPSHQQYKNKGVVSVLMNCQWQSLLCQVEAGVLNMFAKDEDEEETRRTRAHSPQYTMQLRDCEVKAAADGKYPHRIALSVLGEQLAVLEVSSADEKRQWTRLLKDAAAGYHDDKTQQHTHLRHTLNTYMDQPFHASPQPQPVYSNSPMLEHMLHNSQDAAVIYTNSAFSSHSLTLQGFALAKNRKWSEVAPRGIQKLDLTGRKGVAMRAGSEANLVSATNQNKRSSFRQSLAMCSERAQASLLNPLLRRTASVKTSLSRTPSALFIEHGKVFQRRKEWETKAAP
ncbi:actin filament-associated protein 1-like 2 isoform X2 [Phyllopteryx taeniolatus]|uniref:actin filament-associated protein 1-like 2 isoform X2 n=1 Tax=Phyllopteryx taeniolatus TaxID=161469 RepID=UPI002AD25D0E|nr:actin filament-associated protein 1-like 2 isoform X2 [Phyllopteryx taeniolatus]